MTEERNRAECHRYQRAARLYGWIVVGGLALYALALLSLFLHVRVINRTVSAIHQRQDQIMTTQAQILRHLHADSWEEWWNEGGPAVGDR